MEQPEPEAQIADSLLDLIGNTPLVRLNRVTEGLTCSVVAKLEMLNPGGSVKDRPALAMIEQAERDGALKPGGTIVEPTSGNTGVGLAIVAAQRGYRCIFVMTDKVAPEKIRLLEAYGAEVIVCPVAVEPDDPQSYYSVAERLVRETPGAFRPNQYDNDWNPWAHEHSTGPEIWRQTAGRVTHFVAGVGTGGTITGVGRYLKAQDPGIQIVGADPEGSVYSGGSGRPYLVEGIGEDFWPTTYDPLARRPGGAGQRRGQLPHGPPGHPRGGPAHRRLGRHRRGGGARGRPGPRSRAPGGGVDPRLGARLPVAGLRRGLDGRLRVPPGRRRAHGGGHHRGPPGGHPAARVHPARRDGAPGRQRHARATACRSSRWRRARCRWPRPRSSARSTSWRSWTGPSTTRP